MTVRTSSTDLDCSAMKGHISAGLAEWLSTKGMDHVRGAPLHLQTQGNIERCHQTLKNPVLLED